MTSKKNMFLLILTMIMGIGYASINSVTGDIDGTAIANAQDGVFITNVEYVSNINANTSNSRINNYIGTMMNSTIQLSDTDVNSSITYKVTVYNKSEEEAVFTKIRYANNFYDNADIIFDISGFTTGETIAPNESKDITITFKYKGTSVPSNKKLNSYLNFKISPPNRMLTAEKTNDVTANYLNGDITKEKVETISFKMGKESNITAEIKSKFDASEKQDESIIGYYTDENDDGMYDLTFMSEDVIYANKDASNLFLYLKNLKSIDFANFNTSGVTNMESMFDFCQSLTSLNVSGFDTSKVTNVHRMFEFCKELTSLNVSNFDTSQITNMGSMFDNCRNLTSLDVSNFNTSKVTYMASMFGYCQTLTSLDVSNFDTSNVTSMISMFNGCQGLTSLDVSNFDTSNVTRIGMMFGACKGLTNLDLSKFDTKNVTDMASLFFLCTGLTSINLSNFNTSQVTDMQQMFSYCTSLTSIDLSKFDTSNVTKMIQMFNSCSKLTNLNLSVFDTSKVTNMQGMFSGCYGLTTLDLSNFNTSNVTNMGTMFSLCTKLTTIYVSDNFSIDNVTKSDSMFNWCSRLVGGSGTKYNSSYIDKTYARIDKSGQPGYFTKKN